MTTTSKAAFLPSATASFAVISPVSDGINMSILVQQSMLYALGMGYLYQGYLFWFHNPLVILAQILKSASMESEC